MDASKPDNDSILIIGELPAELSDLTATLADEGYDVRSSTGGRTGLEAAIESPPDLMLMANHLPDMDNYELCELLVKDESTCGIPIIFIGTLAEPRDKARIIAAGGVDYVAAPFHEIEVLTRVRMQLAMSAMRTQLAEKDAQLGQAITQLKSAEEAIRAAEESGRELVESLSEVIYTCDNEGVLTYVSSGIESLLGYHPSEVVGRHLSEFVHEDDLPRARESSGQVYSNEYAADEYRVVTKSGEVRWIRTSSQPDSMSERQMGMQGVLTDITEQRLASELIRQQNEFLNRVLESLTHPFYVLDVRDYKVKIANSAALRQSQAGQVTCYALTHGRSDPCDAVEHPCPLEEIKKTKQPVTVEHIHFDRDGNARNVEVHGYPLFDQKGDVVQVIEYALDITERRQAEEALERSDERYALAQRAADIGSWDWDIRTGDLHWSDQIEPMFGLAPGEFSGTYDSFLQLVHPEDRQHVADAVDASIQRGADYALEHRIVWPDGTVRWVSQIGDTVWDRHGKAIRMLGVVQDVTERKQAEEALLESEARWRSVTENSPDHVILLDRDLRIQFVNRASPGLTQEELLGTPLVMYAPQERQSEIKEILTNVLRTAESASYETEYSAPDGGVIYYESRVVPRILNGKAIGLAVNARDITEHKRAEQALREAKESAEDAWREEGERRREAERRRQIAESLANVLAALNSDQSLDRVLEFIARQSRRLLDSQAVAIFRLQDQADTLALQAAQGLPSNCLDGTNPPPGLESLGQAITSGQPVVVPIQVRAQPDNNGQVLDVGSTEPSESKAGMCQTLLAVPIAVRDLVYGGIVIYDEESRAFSDDDLELATVFGDQVALAIESARIREQLKEAAAAAERSRLARDLHDSVTQALFSASLVAEVLPQVWQRNPEEAQQGLEELRHLTKSALAEMRTMLLELRPQALLETSLNDLLLQLTEAITSRAELVISFETEPIPALPPDVHVTFYRVGQEALHNVVKYAEASHLSVSLRASPPLEGQRASAWQGQVILHISDDGSGFDPGDTVQGQLGLGIMRERAEDVGAMLSIESSPGHGTKITLVWRST